MKRSMSMVAALMVAHALTACGGARPIQQSDEVASSDEGGERRGRRAPRSGDRSEDGGDEEEEGEEGEEGRRPARASRESSPDDFPLGERIAIPGTGVSLEPPRGTERSSSGSTLIHPRRRIQIVVAAAEGDLSVHQQFRTGLSGDAEELESQEIEVDGVPATLVVDRMSQGQAELERVWILAREGTRSAAIMGLYAADRSETLRDYLKASVRTVQLDPSVAIDPEAALGYRVAPEGLQLVRASSTNVAYSSDGAPPPGVGPPMMMLMPLPIQVPEAQRTELCPQILEQMVQLEGENTEQAAITADGLSGCDRAATTTQDPRLATYTAILFRGDAAFMVIGSTEAAGRARWLPRFRAAARTLAPTTPAP